MPFEDDAAEIADRFDDRDSGTTTKRKSDGADGDEVSELRDRVVALESDVADLARLLSVALKELGV